MESEEGVDMERKEYLACCLNLVKEVGGTRSMMKVGRHVREVVREGNGGKAGRSQAGVKSETKDR